MRLRRVTLLLAAAALSACNAGEADRSGNEAASEKAGTPTATAQADESARAAPAPSGFDRLGAIRIGATLRELAKDGVIVEGQDEPLEEGASCTYATFRDMPDLAVMLDGEHIVRIDVASPQQETLGGVRVGHGEAEALRRLGGKARVHPHPYTGPEGHYLVVHEEGAPRGLILETDGKTVQSWRIGQWEQVQWVEGCA